ncbi:MAG TPA: protein phosphatase 2C domain-containing protein [Bacteriovoracaceae bacterium]|nr:protein phosphatase 2C domain-containing protein [Bacteriovoracaceae bacterium]
MRLKAYAAQTHQGPYLQVNEDSYEFDFENDLFMVIDGFGGSGTGDRAVEKLKAEIKNFYTQISDDPNATMPLYYNPRNLLEGNAILNSIINAHQNLLKHNAQVPLGQRAGASVVVAVKADSLLILIGVGSCSAYHFRQGKLSKVIVEDTFGNLCKDNHDMRFRTAPMNALGMYPEIGHQMREIRLAEGDKVILLTDGIYSQVNEDELLYALNKSSPDANERINSLLKLSNARGNLDNQTAMILEF